MSRKNVALGNNGFVSSSNQRNQKQRKVVQRAVCETMECRRLLSTYSVNGTTGDDVIRIMKNASLSTQLDVFVNNSTSTPTSTIDLNTYDSVSVVGGNGADETIIDLANGSPIPTNGFAFDGGSGTDVLTVKGTSGNQSIEATAAGISIGGSTVSVSSSGTSFKLGSGLDEILVSGGTWLFDDDLSLTNASLRLSVSGTAAVTFDATQHLRSLELENSSVVTMSDGGTHVLKTAYLNIADAAQFDLNDNSMIVTHAGGDLETTLDTITGYINTGLDLAGSNFWNGPGISSSVAAADAEYLTGIGIISNNAGVYQEGSTSEVLTTFAGESVTANSILICFTYMGDTDLSGHLDFQDEAIMPSGVETGYIGWATGDFDYDGFVTSTDYTLFDNAKAWEGVFSGSTSISEAATYTLNLPQGCRFGTNINGWVIDWGDGTAPSVIGGHPSQATHAYAYGGQTYNLVATPTAPRGMHPLFTGEINVNVINPMAITGDARLALATTQTYTLTLHYARNIPAASVDWNIDWGDASDPDNDSVPGERFDDLNIYSGHSISVEHEYASDTQEYHIIASASISGQTYIVTKIVLADGPTPQRPTAVNMTLSGDEWTPYHATLHWTNQATNAEGFEIERAKSLDGPWTQIADLADTVSANTDSQELLENFNYRIRAYNNAGDSVWVYASPDYGGESRSVPVSATVEDSPAQVSLAWPQFLHAEEYKVYRKSKSSESWGSPIATLPGDTTGFLDTDVELGQAYEYRVARKQSLSTTSFLPGEIVNGYVLAGIRVPLKEGRGTMILVVDNTIAGALQYDLARLTQDLVGDGWEVIRHDVSRHVDTNHSNASHADEDLYIASIAYVKSLIQNDYDTLLADTIAGNEVASVLLFGHVPVPYSGNRAWDGHDTPAYGPVHKGAWPADVFYGDMNGEWTDAIASTSSNAYPPTYELNWNEPGDGKFDQEHLDASQSPEISIGRVDMANMTDDTLVHGFQETEIELLRRYLQKDHDFRHVVFTAERKGLIDHAFANMSHTQWNAESSMFGSENIVAADWFSMLNTDTFLWASGNGPGSATEAAGIGRTGTHSSMGWGSSSTPERAFSVTSSKAVFSMLYGSFFGDWNLPNNFLRAPLANEGYGLASAWNGVEAGQYHRMALGDSIGEGILLTQQKSGEIYFELALPTDLFSPIYQSLMGDPTLRLHIVAPATNLHATSAIGGGVRLDWTASTDTSIEGYHVYRADSSDGPFTRITTGSPVTGLNYTDTAGTYGTSVYMVRAIKLEMSGSGTYFNASQGAFVGQITGTSGNDTIRIVRDVSVATQINVFVNNTSTTPSFTIDASSTSLIDIAGLDGNDTIVIDYSNGAMAATDGINADGNGGINTLKVVGTGSTNILAMNGLTAEFDSSSFQYRNVTALDLLLGAGDDEFSVTGGSLSIDQDLAIGTPDLQVLVGGDASLVLNTSQILNSLTLEDQARVVLIADGGLMLTVTALTIDDQAALDLNDNAMVVDFSGSSDPSALIRSYLHSGLNADDENEDFWGGTGIMSSVARAETEHLHGFGYVANSLLLDPAFPADSIVIKYTYFGDADLSGDIDGTDYSLIDTGFLNSLSDWVYGDFDYNGIVDGTDYMLIDNGFNHLHP